MEKKRTNKIFALQKSKKTVKKGNIFSYQAT